MSIELVVAVTLAWGFGMGMLTGWSLWGNRRKNSNADVPSDCEYDSFDGDIGTRSGRL